MSETIFIVDVLDTEDMQTQRCMCNDKDTLVNLLLHIDKKYKVLDISTVAGLVSYKNFLKTDGLEIGGKE